MKKILFMCLITLGIVFNSCIATKEYSYTSPIDYMNELKDLNEYYNGKGFYLNGESWNTENDLHIEGYEYFINHFSLNNNHGVVTQVVPNIKNDYLYKNTYKFQDSIGNTISFTLGYKIGQFESLEKLENSNNDFEKCLYDEIIYSEVCDCETNNFNNFIDLCKNDEIQKFNNDLEKKSIQKINYYDSKKSWTVSSICITAIVGLSFLWIGLR